MLVSWACWRDMFKFWHGRWSLSLRPAFSDSSESYERGSQAGSQAVSRAGRQYHAARRMAAAPTVSTVTPGSLQVFSRAKGKYPPLAVAWYLFLVHIARRYPSLVVVSPSRGV